MRTNWGFVSAFVCLLLLTLASCDSKDSEDQTTIPPATESVLSDVPVPLSDMQKAKFASENADFAFVLFRKVLESQPADANMVFSPLSISMALGMLANGTDDDGSTAIARLMGFGGSIDELNAYCRYVRETGSALDPEVALSLANCAGIAYYEKPDKRFAGRLRTFYGADVMQLDFTKPADVQTLNDWVAARTSQKIQNMFQASDFRRETTFVLANAFHFGAPWTSPFSEEQTTMEPFMKENGQQVSLPMMRQQLDDALMATTSDYSSIVLPYGGRRQFSMTILLPASDKTVADVVAGLSAASWSQLHGALVSVKNVQVSLPRFSVDTGRMDLVGLLQGMGAKVTEWNLPFLLEDSDAGRVQDIFQNVRLDVMEKGAEGAVASAIIGGRGSGTRFKASRPFVFVISDDTTHAIYFAGVFKGGAA